MFQEDMENDIDLAGGASRNTIATGASWLGWGLLLLLAIVTAVHAISITLHHTRLSPAGGDVFTVVRVGGVVLVELFAVVAAVMLATHKLRASQKPAALVLELTWVIFAAINLVSSFAIEHGGDLPAFVSTWVTYGLPISALVVGVEFYVIQRLDPDAKRADDDAELLEKFAKVKHSARLEVMASPQMRAVIRQAVWQQLPPIVGRQMNLSDSQIRALTSQAPRLLDLNQNGVPDIQEQGSGNNERLSLAELQRLLDEAHNGNGGNGRANDSSFLR